MRTTLDSSDAEAVCASLQRDPLLPGELAQVLAQRVRLAADTRPLAQRNLGAVRAALERPPAVPLTRPEPEVFRIARRRIWLYAAELGLERPLSDPTIRRCVRLLIAESRKVPANLSPAVPERSYAGGQSNEEAADGQERSPAT